MRANSGFTLLELLLVMVIIGILASMVAFSVAGQSEKARITAAQSDLATYQRAIETFALQNKDKYPSDLKQLKGGKLDYVMKVSKDPWGNDYIYKYPGKSGERYDLYSRGPDGQDSTVDDISVWDIEEPAEGTP